MAAVAGATYEETEKKMTVARPEFFSHLSFDFGMTN